MLWIHPVWQIFAIFLACYVFYLGWARFAASNLGKRMPFLWKRHVALGKTAIYMWVYGACVGAAAAWVNWRAFRVTGIHFWLGITIGLLALFGYLSGLHMDIYKKKRKVLPLIHGGNNLLLLILSLLSIATGTRVISRLIP